MFVVATAVVLSEVLVVASFFEMSCAKFVVSSTTSLAFFAIPRSKTRSQAIEKESQLQHVFSSFIQFV